jgi:hypothetical protein
LRRHLKNLKALKELGPSYVMFMKIHGDDPKESNGLYKSGSAAMPVALGCDE